MNSNLGRLRTSATIVQAQNEIKIWLDRIGIPSLAVQCSYDNQGNVAIVNFKYKNQSYEFRSTKQDNARLNMHGIARVMEYKVRSHIMDIEDFQKSMKSYLQIENKSSFTSSRPIYQAEDKYYQILGVNRNMSNEEIKKIYNFRMKSWHPDMANSEEAKKEFEKRASTINEAYTEIKKERGLINNE